MLGSLPSRLARRLPVFVASAILIGLVAVVLVGPEPRSLSSSGVAGEPIAATLAGRITVCELRFCLNGATFYPYGASFYSSTSRSGILSNPSGAIRLALAQHLNMVRTDDWLSHDAPVSSATTNSSWAPLDQFIVGRARRWAEGLPGPFRLQILAHEALPQPLYRLS